MAFAQVSGSAWLSHAWQMVTLRPPELLPGAGLPVPIPHLSDAPAGAFAVGLVHCGLVLFSVK